MSHSPDLVALVGSRIAHDLANPLGAIANGVELLALTGQGDSPELALVTQSVTNATARIKAFRIAFGAAAQGQAVKAEELRGLFAPENGHGKLSVDWDVPASMSREEAKLILLAMMCLETAMPWGGRVNVRLDGGAGRLAGAADRLNPDPALWDWMAGTGAEPADVAPAQVQFLLLPAEARAQGRALSVARRDDRIEIDFGRGA